MKYISNPVWTLLQRTRVFPSKRDVGSRAVKKYLQIRMLSLFLAAATVGLAQPPASSESVQPQEVPAVQEISPTRNFPLDVAGYVDFRYLNDDAFQQHNFFRQYSASLFLSKTIGRWRFHSEFNADTAPELDSDGIHLIRPRPSLSVKLDSAFLNYNIRDWLQVQTGLLFIPTYWRTHRYQSTTLTVDEPMIDQNIFPTALKGGALYGDKYWGEGGVSYMLYGGVDQQSDFRETTQTVGTEGAHVIGGKFAVHLPSREFFSTFDVAFHRLHQVDRGGKPDEMYGVELQLRKSRVEVLGEFDHASLDLVNGVPSHIRQGYYIQPSYRITPKLFAVVRYDRLNRNSLYADQDSLARQSAGLTYRPIPSVSLKIEADRYEPQAGRLPAYYGVTAGAVWFFHLP